MKNLFQKVQELGKKAGEIRAAVQGAPAKAAELRQALTMTAGEFQQLRADVQANAKGLHASNEENLLQAMREINDRTYTFEEAGYELTSMDLDLTFNQRLAVHLRRFKDVGQSDLHSLVRRENSATIKSILAGILKAEETAANVELTHLKYDGLVLHVGSTPLIRISWSADTWQDEKQTTAPKINIPEAVVSPSAPPTSAFGTLFEARPTTPLSPTPVVSTTLAELKIEERIASAPVPMTTSVNLNPRIAIPEDAPSPWSKEALDRFKKMPNLSKHRPT